MTVGMSFITIVSLLLALGGGSSEDFLGNRRADGSQQESLTTRKGGGKQTDWLVGTASPQPASQSARSKLATNHNETLVSDTSTQQPDVLSKLLTNTQWVVLTRFTSFVSGTGCAPFICGTDGNHNETLVRDRSSGIGGGCATFLCGSESNHNETLMRDKTALQ